MPAPHASYRDENHLSPGPPGAPVRHPLTVPLHRTRCDSRNPQLLLLRPCSKPSPREKHSRQCAGKPTTCQPIGQGYPAPLCRRPRLLLSAGRTPLESQPSNRTQAPNQASFEQANPATPHKDTKLLFRSKELHTPCCISVPLSGYQGCYCIIVHPDVAIVMPGASSPNLIPQRHTTTMQANLKTFNITYTPWGAHTAATMDCPVGHQTPYQRQRSGCEEQTL